MVAIDVATPVYEGPFDLLLHLILREEVDIHEISLSTIVDAYLAELLKMQELDLEGELQVASFHPEFQFADTEPDDIGNFTNRSPYPTLHLLREESIDRAVDAFPEAEMIYETNIETMDKLGVEGWKKLDVGPSP